jgi:8-hydroxy-5-deazaflavin:NADPH oxidoreductase
MQALPTLAILGGTGALGTGLAMRWADAGYPIVIGSRSREKAQAAASTIAARGGAASVTGEDNAGAARTGDIVVIAVPWTTHDAILSEIKSLVSGKIVVDAVVPLVPPKVSVVQLPSAGSAGVIAHNTLGEDVKVVSAFHNVAAAKLQSGAEIDCDVLVFGNDREARDAVIELAKALGTRGVDGGPIANSVAAEALTAVLIGINRRYKIPGAGIRITGL